MRPNFHPSLINGPFDDPGVYVDFLFERRALLFDLGDPGDLTPRKLLRVSHIFISHTHVDHFIGFDNLVRLCLGREKRLHLFGPPGFADRVGHRLAGYTWNLVQDYPTDFTVVATELNPDGTALTAEFHCLRQFAREADRRETFHDGIILDEETFRVRVAHLEHRIPSLAFALEEKHHVSVKKNRLAERGWRVGPWLAELKRAILADVAVDAPFRVWWREGDREHEEFHPLGLLKDEVVTIVPGQKIAYVTDAVFTAENAARIVELARGADYLFIEAVFLHAEAERAFSRCHLTARQAGELARAAGVDRVLPFHFSPRYQYAEEEVRREVMTAFAGTGEEG
jgi:ribonuclease Z